VAYFSENFSGPPPSRHEVGCSSHRCTTPRPMCQEETSSDDSVELSVVAPPTLCLQVDTPPPTRLAAPPPPTHVEESSDNSPSDSSGYNDECPHIKEVSSY
jgi:hypothetical protein